jgi:hypothetical protein
MHLPRKDLSEIVVTSVTSVTNVNSILKGVQK